MSKRKKMIEYCVWVFISAILWWWSFAEVMALYPDWNPERAKVLAFLIRGCLVVSWFSWLVANFIKHSSQIIIWIRIGVGSAFVISIVRLFFYKQLNGLLDLFVGT